MVKRKIVEIDEDKCTGCGACVTTCAEGALAIVGGKAKVVSEVFCDGLGACIGDCPEGALRIIEREAPEFDEEAVKEHLEGRKERGRAEPIGAEPCGCPSHNPLLLKASSQHGHHHRGPSPARQEQLPPELTNWPIQWRLVRPDMPFFKDAEVLMAADCVPFAFRDFHGRFLAGRPVIIGCPKLDDQQQYLERLTEVIRDSGLRSINIVHMEVPCCHGLRRLVAEAVRRSGRNVPMRTTVVGIQGEVMEAG